MNPELTIEADIHFQRQLRGASKTLHVGTPAVEPVGRVPRVTKLMALALRFQKLLLSGAVRDHAELARLGQVTRARISQIMNLLNLAPYIIEALLHLPRVETGRPPIHLRQLQPLCMVADWQRQMRMWAALVGRMR